MEARPGARLSETAARGILKTEDGIECRPRSSAPFSSAYRRAVVVPDLHIAGSSVSGVGSPIAAELQRGQHGFCSTEETTQLEALPCLQSSLDLCD
jgi:hypothetical protein